MSVNANVSAHQPHQSPLVLGLAAMFAGMTALLAIGAVVSGSVVALGVAAPLGVTSYVMYYHGSGKLARAMTRAHHRRQFRRTHERDRGGFGAGPRERGGPRTRAERRAHEQFGSRGEREYEYGEWHSSGPTIAEARSVLGVDATADQSDIRRAYREKVKDVHPDRGGTKEEFTRVTAAYDRLNDSS